MKQRNTSEMTVTRHNKFSADELEKLREEYEADDKTVDDEMSQSEIDLLRLKRSDSLRFRNATRVQRLLEDCLAT